MSFHNNFVVIKMIGLVIHTTLLCVFDQVILYQTDVLVVNLTVKDDSWFMDWTE